MKIRKIDIFRAPIRLKEPFKISLGTVAFANNLIIRIHCESGGVGFGECSPFLSIHGESLDTAACVANLIAPYLIGQHASNIRECSEIMNKVIYGNTCVKSAFNMACYDLAAQEANQPLYAYLGGVNDRLLQTDYTVSIDAPGKMAHDAAQIQANGFEIIKVKLGGTKEQDVERIQAIRHAVGDAPILRIDANQGWQPAEAADILNALAVYSIQHCEEPISRARSFELHKVRQESAIPILADESCLDQHDAERLILSKACDGFNLKLSKSSGLCNVIGITQLAQKAGLDLQFGGFLESRLGFSAAAHLALAYPAIKHFDFDTPMMFTHDPVIGGIEYKNRGYIKVPDAVGIGASYDDAFLRGLDQVTV